MWDQMCRNMSPFEDRLQNHPKLCTLSYFHNHFDLFHPDCKQSKDTEVLERDQRGSGTSSVAIRNRYKHFFPLDVVGNTLYDLVHLKHS